MPSRRVSSSSTAECRYEAPRRDQKAALPRLLEVSGSAPPATDPGRASVSPWIAGAVVVATILRLFRLGQNSLWADEVASARIVILPFFEIPAVALHGSAFEPPVYFWLLHAVSSVFGTSETALRALSAAAGILTVPVTWLLVRDLTGRQTSATIVAFLLATNPLHVWYSQEARPYSVALLFGLGSLLCVRLAIRTGRGAAWIGYAALGALATLSHVVAIVLPAVAAVWVALDARRWEVVSKFAAASVGLLLLIAPFLIALAGSIEPGSTGSAPRPLTGLEAPYSLLTYVAGYSFGPSVREIQNLGWRVAIERHLIQTIVAATTLVAIIALVLRARSRTVWHLGALLVLPLAAALLGSATTTKAYNVRYALPALIGFLGLTGVAAAELKPAARRAVVGALLLVSLWADVQWFFVPAYWKEDSRAAVACLSDEVGANGRVAVTPRYMRGVLDYYARRAGTGISIIGVSTAQDLATSGPTALLTTRLHHAPDAVALVRAFREGSDGAVLEGRVPGYQIYAVSSDVNRARLRLACGTQK